MGDVVLRALRQPRAGQPSPLARALALLVVLGMIAVSAPVLVLVARWFLQLF
jgi:hypothetical protein